MLSLWYQTAAVIFICLNVIIGEYILTPGLPESSYYSLIYILVSYTTSVREKEKQQFDFTQLRVDLSDLY